MAYIQHELDHLCQHGLLKMQSAHINGSRLICGLTFVLVVIAFTELCELLWEKLCLHSLSLHLT